MSETTTDPDSDESELDTSEEPEPESESESETEPEPADAPSVPDVTGITLLEDEEVLQDTRPSWAMYSGSLAWGVLTIWFGVGLIFFLYAFLARSNHRYIVTNQRLIEKSGLLSSSSTEYRIRDIRQLQTGASFTEKLASCGHITFSSGAGTTVTFQGVKNYQDIANTIREQQRRLE